MSQESAKTMGRLVLTLKHDEKIKIGSNVTVEFLFAKGQHVRLAFTAPLDERIVREKIEKKEGDK